MHVFNNLQYYLLQSGANVEQAFSDPEKCVMHICDLFQSIMVKIHYEFFSFTT